MNSNGTNSANMKYNNRQLIKNIIRKQRVSRAELARITGLTRAAVTLLIDEMIGEGLVIETGAAEASYGRKPVLLDLNCSSYFAVGIYISRDVCDVGIVDIKGKTVIKESISIHAFADAYECIKAISLKIKELIRKSKIPDAKILGIGVSTPGPVDIYNGVILTPPNFNAWHNIAVVDEFKKEFDYRIMLDNNSTSLALAEKSYGRGAEFSSFMLMVVNEGIGAGIIINDRLYRGAGGFGSEVGHTSVNMEGEICNCGNRGCLELYAAIPAVLTSMQKKKKSIGAWNEIVDEAMQGDPNCICAINKEAHYLSTGIINVINLLELDAVILTGSVNYKPELLLQKIRNSVNSQAINRNTNKLQILTSSITKDSEVISAAAIVIEDFFCT